MNQPEAELQKAVVQILRVGLSGGAFVFATLGERRVSPQAGKRLNDMGRLPGIADLGVVHEGRIHWIELKTDKAPGVAKGYQSPAQHQFEATARLAGAPYAVCRSSKEVEMFLRSHGVPLTVSVV